MINKVILLGRLGGNAEVKHLDSGQTVCSFSLATGKKWKDKNGENRERTEWHKCVLWGPRAQGVGPLLEKGRLVFVEGEIQTRKWQAKDGTDRYSTEILVQDVQLAGSGNRDESGGADEQEPEPGMFG